MIARNVLVLGALTFTTSCGSSASPQGAVDGACFPNNTCNTGLVCTLVNGSALCEQPDATTDATVDAPADAPALDAPADAPATDASSDGASDAGNADACTGSVDAGSIDVLCASKKCGSAGCCAGNLPPQCATGLCPDGFDPWACTQKSDCNGGTPVCCVGVTIADSNVCPWQANYYTVSAKCQATCGAGYFALCASNADCPSTQTCTPTIGVAASGTIGLCQ